jgi:hypothetical protein
MARIPHRRVDAMGLRRHARLTLYRRGVVRPLTFKVLNGIFDSASTHQSVDLFPELSCHECVPSNRCPIPKVTVLILCPRAASAAFQSNRCGHIVIGPLRVKGCLASDVGITDGVPQRAADFAALQRSTALGQIRTLRSATTTSISLFIRLHGQTGFPVRVVIEPRIDIKVAA